MQFGETDIYQQWYHIVICHCTVYDMNDVIAVDNFDGTPPRHKSRQMAFKYVTMYTTELSIVGTPFLMIPKVFTRSPFLRT